MPELHRIIGRATKCGPAAVSAIAGVPTHEAAAIMRDLTGRRSINRTNSLEMLYTLEWYGFDLLGGFLAKNHDKWQEDHGIPADNQGWPDMNLRQFDGMGNNGIWLIAVSRHWLAYADGFVADSGYRFARMPQRLAGFSKGCGSKIKAAYRVGRLAR